MAITKRFEAKLQDNAASTTVVAAVGSNGTLTGAGNTSASSAVGPGGLLPLSLTFDGTNDYVDFPSVTGSGTSATFICWVWRNGNQSAFDGLFKASTSGLIMGSATELRYIWNGTSSTFNWSSGITIPNQSWCLCAVTITPTEGKLYCISSSGTSVATNTVTHASNSYMASMKVANDSNAGGRFANIRAAGCLVYDTTFTQAMLESIYSGVIAGSTPSNILSPTIAGTTKVDRYLQATVGEFVNDDSVSYQWYENTANSTSGGTPISGATSLTSPLITSASVGKYIYFVSTGTNSAGNTDAVSNVLGPVAAANAAGTGIDPDEVTSATLHAWYSCRDPACFGGTFPADGAQVNWEDKSGASGIDLLVEAPNARPVYRFNQVDGYGSIYGGTNDARFTAATLFTGSWSTFTIVFVVKDEATSGSNDLLRTTDGAYVINGLNTTGTPSRTGWNNARSRGTGYRVFSHTINGATISSGVPPEKAVWCDGSCYGTGSDIGTIATNASLRVFGNAGQSQKSIAELIIYQGALSVVETAQVHRNLMAAYGIESHDNRAFVAVGNSMTNNNWPMYVVNDLYDDEGVDAEYYNLAIGGGTSTTLANQSAMFDALRADLNARNVKAVFLLWHGHNDGSWTSTVTDALEDYPAPWRSDGHLAIGLTLSPRSTGTTAYETTWLASESWFAANGLTYFDAVGHTNELDWMDEILDPFTDPNNYWNVDGLHLEEAAQQPFADWNRPKILTLFQSFAATGGNSFSSPLQGPFFSPAFSPLNPIISIAGG